MKCRLSLLLSAVVCVFCLSSIAAKQTPQASTQRQDEQTSEDAVAEKYQFLAETIDNQRSQKWIDETNLDFQSTDPGAEAASAGAGVTVLSVSEKTNNIAGFPLRHRCYNGRLTGPVMVARPGETLEVLLKNNLEPEASQHSHDVNQPHGFNDTNLHTHGLHIDPTGEQDNVLRVLRPQQQFRYRYQIPREHAPGTHWYHAHKHGSVALQLASGMAGPLIIEGGLDFAGFMSEIDDRILVLQQFMFSETSDGRFEVTEGDVYGLSDPTRLNNLTAINGVVGPTIRLRPGQIERWRVIHAGLNTTINLQLGSHRLHEVAADGITFGWRDSKNVIEMHPGNRSDFLVKANSTPGTYYLINQVDASQNAVRGISVPRTFLAKVVVEGVPMTTKLPTDEQLAPFALFKPIEDEEITGRREILLESGRDGKFRLGGKLYDENTRNFRVRLGDVEEWNLRAIRGEHPFHAHINPFQVVVPGSDGGPSRIRWQDVVFVPAGKSRRVRMRFERFTGPLVMHCHILDHEDKGMMGIAEIDPESSPREHEAQSVSSLESRLLDNSGKKFRSNLKDSADWSVEHVPDGFRDLALRRLGIPRSRTEKRAVLFVFHKGIHCIHCMEQLGRIAEKADELVALGVQPIAVCPSLPDFHRLKEMKDALGITYPLAVDKKLVLSRAIGCLDEQGDSGHALVLADENGKPLFRVSTKHAVTDINKIIAECRTHLQNR